MTSVLAGYVIMTATQSALNGAAKAKKRIHDSLSRRQALYRLRHRAPSRAIGRFFFMKLSFCGFPHGKKKHVLIIPLPSYHCMGPCSKQGLLLRKCAFHDNNYYKSSKMLQTGNEIAHVSMNLQKVQRKYSIQRGASMLKLVQVLTEDSDEIKTYKVNNKNVLT